MKVSGVVQVQFYGDVSEIERQVIMRGVERLMVTVGDYRRVQSKPCPALRWADQVGKRERERVKRAKRGEE